MQVPIGGDLIESFADECLIQGLDATCGGRANKLYL